MEVQPQHVIMLVDQLRTEELNASRKENLMSQSNPSQGIFAQSPQENEEFEAMFKVKLKALNNQQLV